MSARTRDLWVGVGTAALFAYVIFAVIPAQIRTPASLSNVVMSPAFWPTVVAALAVVLGLALAAKAIISGESADEGGESSPTTRRTLAAIGIIGGYYLLLEPLGIVLASMIVLPALGVLYGERRILVLAPIAALLPLGLYLFFTRVANIPMPLGPLAELI